MKCSRFAIALLALTTGHELVLAARLGETPMAKVVTLLKNMKTDIESTGKSEQSSYDKYSCWCEETLAEKAEDITKAKDKLESLQNNINKNKGGLGSGGATIVQLNKDIAENIASMKEATEVRDKEHSEYEEERTSSEQCIGALEAGIKVLTGAGTGKKGFLETIQQAQLLSVVASMRPVLKAQAVKQMKEGDLKIVHEFVEKPEDFLKGRALGAVQIGQNPFGDYAPQSTRIQGILKSMYDSFTSDLEKDNADEGSRQKSFEELKATKERELGTLESSLQSETKSDAERTKSVADDKAMRDETQDQLAADEAFFAQSKEACSKKATNWASRSRLRSQEIAGIDKAVEILNSDEAKKSFEESQNFLQISSAIRRRGDHGTRAAAYKRLRTLATQHHSLQLAQIASAVKTKGHFDDVIVMIDKMVVSLREEEQEDIAHRDRCENKQNGNKNAKEDAEHVKQKAEDAIERLDADIETKKGEISDLDIKMGEIKTEMGDNKEKREEETAEFKKEHKADADSIELLEQAKSELGKFYARSFLQVEPAVTPAKVQMVAAKPAPNTNFEDGNYKGAAGAARGVVSIIDMIIEDITKEMKSQGQDEIDAQTAFEEQRSVLTKDYRATEKAKVGAEGELADLKNEKNDQTETKDAAQNDIDNEITTAENIEQDCNWVETNFEKRRTSRKAELDGLADAKDFLAGAGSDSDLDMP